MFTSPNLLFLLLLCATCVGSFVVPRGWVRQCSTGAGGSDQRTKGADCRNPRSCSTGSITSSSFFKMGVDDKLRTLRIALPDVAPAGNYVLYRRSADTLYLSGHLPKAPDGTLTTGKVGADLDVEQAAEAARLVAINLITTMKAASGDLDKIRLVKITGFVHSADGFTSQSQVLNGASDLFLEVFGQEKGAHARSAVGVNSLPLGVCVEIEAIVEIEP